jgi:hypothetical protein
VPPADAVDLGEGTCVAWVDLLMPGYSCFVSSVCVAVSGRHERKKAAAQFPVEKRGGYFVGGAGGARVGASHSRLAKTGLGAWSFDKQREEHRGSLLFCFSTQARMGTGPSKETLLWPKGTSSGIVVVVVVLG